MDVKVFGGRYEISEKIGSGGMADVYRATDSILNRTVAIKVLHPHFANEEDFVARFKREAQAAANLNHPNIVNIYDWGAEDSTYFIVMEYLIGKSLKEIIDEQAPLDENLIIDIGRQVLLAVEAAHKSDLVHRDIKPHNIIITENGDVKVMDFGIARSTSSTMTQTGSIMGTAFYLSPEQAQGAEVSSASDLYSVGIVLYEMSTGNVPFKGESPVSIALKHVHEAPVPPRRLNPDLSLSLQTIILKAISKNPNDRYSDAAELRHDLGKSANGELIEPTSASGEETIIIPATTGIVKDNNNEDDDKGKDKKKKPKWWILITALIVLALIGAAVGYFIYLDRTTTTVPKITSLSEKSAKKDLKEKGLKMKVTDRVFDAGIPSGKVVSQDPDAGDKIRTGRTVSVVLSRGEEKIEVPKLTGITLDQATFFLAKADLNVGEITREYSDRLEAGVVISQNPPADDGVSKGTNVDLMVSKGPRPIRVPDVIGKTTSEASAEITKEQLKVVKSEEFSDSVEEGRVIRMSPPPGTSIEKDGEVSIVISKGPELISIPDLEGMSQDDAKSELETRGFVVQIKAGISDPENYGKVVAQSPQKEEMAIKGATVTIWIGEPPPP